MFFSLLEVWNVVITQAMRLCEERQMGVNALSRTSTIARTRWETTAARSRCTNQIPRGSCAVLRDVNSKNTCVWILWTPEIRGRRFELQVFHIVLKKCAAGVCLAPARVIAPSLKRLWYAVESMIVPILFLVKLKKTKLCCNRRSGQ